MRKVIDYRQQGARCREIARRITLQDKRSELLEMAEHWDRLADEREARLKQADSIPLGCDPL